MSEFETYKDRAIEFIGTHHVKDWWIKVYTITLHEKFKAEDTLKAVVKNLENVFLKTANASNLLTHQHAFVIVHEGREGVWILFSWWTGGEMLETKVHFSSYKNPTIISPSPHSGALVCTWELEVFIHERKAWIQHVLRNSTNPDFKSYQNDSLNGK